MEIEDNLLYPTPAPAPPILLAAPTPNSPPWGILAAIGVWVASILFILIIPTLFLLPYLAMQRPPITESEKIIEFAKSDPTSIFLQIVAIIPAHLLTIMIAWLVVTRFKKYSFTKTLGWNGGGIGMWLSYPLILIVFFGVAFIIGNYFPEQENDLVRILRSSRSAVYIVAFVATFTAPFVEEVVYRGVLYSAFQRTMGVPTAFLLVTFLFAVVHVPQYYPSYSTIFLLGLLSLILTSIRVKTGNLLPCIILHTVFNGLQSILLIIEPLTKSADVPEPAATILHLIK